MCHFSDWRHLIALEYETLQAWLEVWYGSTAGLLVSYNIAVE
jgi:hypothetical protein